MCRAVYLAASAPLRLVPWAEEAPAFYTELLRPEAKRVKVQFGQTHDYYAGSHEGCGCGFQRGEYPDSTDPAEQEKERKSLRELAAYLQEEAARVGTVQLYACWEGDEDAAPEHRRALTP